MNPGDLVIAVMQNPREQVWGVVHSLSAAGLTVRGINTRNFEEWSRQLGAGSEPELGLETVFFPAHRIERISLDEQIGSVPSLASRFEQITGRAAADTLQKSLD